MIHWLIQDINAHPDLVLGQAPAGLLSDEETAVFNGFKVLKRRQDWLLGRWTAKLLLQEIIQQESGRAVPLDSISILPGKDGAPRVSMNAADADLPQQFTVSISHSHGTSLCAAVSKPDWPLGADIELVEPRSEKFAADFFTVEEQAQINNASLELRETLVTAVWSGKEAALKAIREGLRSDTRSVSCQFTGDSPHSRNWHSFDINWQREADRVQHPALDGWWMADGEFVYTLAVKNNYQITDKVSGPDN